MSADRNRKIQEMLKAEGLYRGKIDGIIGPQTRRALELHDKQQYQPIPRPRPGGGAPPVGPSVPQVPGVPGVPAAPLTSMPPMPDSSAAIQNPSYGGPNPDTATGIRGGVNALLGRETLVDPDRPSYAPNFTGASGPAPMDKQALRDALVRKTLGHILSSAVPLGKATPR